MKTVSTAMSTNAQSQDSGSTTLYADLDVPTNDEQWAMTLETHKYAEATGSVCSVTTENGEQQHLQFDYIAVCTMIIVL